MKILPEKTVERLSEYRRTLLRLKQFGQTHIFSHELAQLHHITAVQVRRDIMFIGYSSPGRRGYVIEELIRVIATIIDAERTMNVAVIGLGKYGTAISSYFVGKRPKLEIVAAFDADSEKEGRKVAGIKCFHIDKLDEVVKDKNISIAILTVPPEHAIDVKDRLVRAGIKGILNFTSVLLDVPDDVYLEEYDMITSLEKVAYFAKLNKKDIPASEI